MFTFAEAFDAIASFNILALIETSFGAAAKKTKAPVQTGTTKAKKMTSTKKEKHLDVATIEDDGLPTLNKVLEAYAKTTGPRGKVGEIN